MSVFNKKTSEKIYKIKNSLLRFESEIGDIYEVLDDKYDRMSDRRKENGDGDDLYSALTYIDECRQALTEAITSIENAEDL